MLHVHIIHETMCFNEVCDSLRFSAHAKFVDSATQNLKIRSIQTASKTRLSFLHVKPIGVNDLGWFGGVTSFPPPNKQKQQQ